MRCLVRYNYQALFTMLLVYFPLSAYTNGVASSTGIVVPCLMIGALVGRIMGLVMTDLFGLHAADEEWQWIDPGAFALIGAAGFFAGVTRLTMSLTVIIIEFSNDVHFLLPIMTAIMTAKFVADFTGCKVRCIVCTLGSLRPRSSFTRTCSCLSRHRSPPLQSISCDLCPFLCPLALLTWLRCFSYLAWIGGSQAIYHALMEQKSLPYLPDQPDCPEGAYLDILSAGQVCICPYPNQPPACLPITHNPILLSLP